MLKYYPISAKIMSNSSFKNVIASLDYDFGNLRIINDKMNNSFINDINLTDSSNDLLSILDKHDCKLFLLIRDKLNPSTFEQIKDFLPSFTNVIPFDRHLDALFSEIKSNFTVKPEETIFISSDRSSRQIASKHKFYALPHNQLAVMAIENKPFEFVQIIGNRSSIDKIPKEDILPYYIKEMDTGICELLTIISNKGLNKAIQLKLKVQSLKFNLSNEDIVIVNLDNKINEQLIEETTSNYGFLYSDNNKMIITVGRNKIANIPIHGNHGHFINLIPDETLLSKTIFSADFKLESMDSVSKTTMNILKKWPYKNIKTKLTNENVPSFIETKLDEINSNSILDNIKRYSGASDLNSEGKIKSRHCLHPHNLRIVQSLEQELKQMGYFVNIWEFQGDEFAPGSPRIPEVEQGTFYNVIAELPGIGDNSLLENDLSSTIRDIFIKYPNPLQNQSWISEIRELVGDEWFKENNLDVFSPLHLKRRIERMFGLETWSNWWIKDKDNPGIGSEIIVIGCHLDSTASMSRPEDRKYEPSNHPAPGTDDDGSGLGATIELARIFSKLKNRLKHTIQFCFFNTEEVGIRGSLKYAGYMKRANAPIRAVICMDMIGYNKDNSNRTYEIHCGYYNESIRNICLPLAYLVEEHAKNLGNLGDAQIYKGLSSGVGEPDEANRDKYDGAIQRSDHWSFQTHGYPAVIVSEDLFINIPNLDPTQDSNPHYHKITDKDTEIDESFVADIASAVVSTVKKLAQQ